MANVVNYVSIAPTVGTTESSTAVRVKKIHLLVNDHASNTLTVNFDNATTEANTIVLKAGERIENLDIEVGTIYYKGSGAGTNFRFIGTRGFSA
jgi:spore germination protein GerM